MGRTWARRGGVSPLQSYTYSPAGDLLVTHTYTNNTDILTETYAYDMLGNRIATTDALGNTTHREWLAPPDAGGSQLAATETAADAQERVPPRGAETAAPHKIAQTAQAIRDARARYPESSLVAYGFASDTPEPGMVAHFISCIQTLGE